MTIIQGHVQIVTNKISQIIYLNTYFYLLHREAYTHVMGMIWKRLNDHGKNWRHVYKVVYTVNN